MLYLILGILFNVAIFIAFRTIAALGIRTLPAIVVNYYICVLTGLVFLGNLEGLPAMLSPENHWFYFALILGVLFIFTFYMIALTTQRLSVTVSSIASKMSLAIPVIFSLFVFQIEAKAFDLFNFAGIFIAFLAIYLSSIRKKEEVKAGEQLLKNRVLLLLPLGVFICGGIIDTTINYTAFTYLTDAEAAVFPLVIFLVAAVVGSALHLATRQHTGLKELLGGIGLGIPNYFSIYFIVKALAAFDNNGAFVYPILNISIILFSSLFAIIVFKEHLLTVNKIGLGLAVLAIFLISYQEIIAYLTSRLD